MIVLHFYTRQGCHLCDVSLESLLPLIRGRAQIEVRDVDTSESWRAAYDVRVPVIEHDGKLIAEYPFEAADVVQLLSEMPEN